MNLDRYRRTFRKKVIPDYYRGKGHIIVFSALEGLALIICGLLVNWHWWSPFIVLSALLIGTVLTYFIHRYFLHRKMPGFSWAFKMHHWHHTFYRSDRMTYDDLNDVYMLLMPPWLQLGYFLIYVPLATIICAWFLPMKIVMPFMFGLIMWYGTYELVHWCEHLSNEHPLMKFKLVQWLRRHHVVHHSDLKDQANFGIVEPSMDYLFRTKY